MFKQVLPQGEFAVHIAKSGYSETTAGSLWGVWIAEGGGFLEEC